MTFTEGKFTQGGSSPDLQVFVGASEFVDTAGLATNASSAAGLFSKNVASTDAATLFANITAMLKRTGVFAIPLYSGFTGTLGTGTANPGADQEAFGTAAALPGPSLVSGTSGPLALAAGVPPQPASTLATLTGGVAGPQPKGFEITSMDVIYEVDTEAATAATCGLTDTVFANNAAAVVTNRIALAANGLTLTTNTAGQQKVINVPVTTPAFPVSADTETVINVNLTAGTGGVVKFFGVVLHINFNLN